MLRFTHMLNITWMRLFEGRTKQCRISLSSSCRTSFKPVSSFHRSMSRDGKVSQILSHSSPFALMTPARFSESDSHHLAQYVVPLKGISTKQILRQHRPNCWDAAKRTTNQQTDVIQLRGWGLAGPIGIDVIFPRSWNEKYASDV